MPDAATRIARLLDELTSVTAQIGFEAARDAVSQWENTQGDDEQPGWHEVLAGGLNHALTVAEDADACADTCHIRIDWSDAGRALTFRFDAGKGAGLDFGATITTAVVKAIRGVE